MCLVVIVVSFLSYEQSYGQRSLLMGTSERCLHPDWLEVAGIQIVRVENRPLTRGEDEAARFVISRLLGGRSPKKLGVGIGMVHRVAQRPSKIPCGVIPEQPLGAFPCTGNPCSSILQVSTATTKQKPP